MPLTSGASVHKPGVTKTYLPTVSGQSPQHCLQKGQPCSRGGGGVSVSSPMKNDCFFMIIRTSYDVYVEMCSSSQSVATTALPFYFFSTYK